MSLVVADDPCRAPFVVGVHDKGPKGDGPGTLEFGIDPFFDPVCATQAWTRHVAQQGAFSILGVGGMALFGLRGPPKSTERDELFGALFD